VINRKFRGKSFILIELYSKLLHATFAVYVQIDAFTFADRVSITQRSVFSFHTTLWSFSGSLNSETKNQLVLLTL
jgi:hypothetical protein